MTETYKQSLDHRCHNAVYKISRWKFSEQQHDGDKEMDAACTFSLFCYWPKTLLGLRFHLNKKVPVLATSRGKP
jgi:hypothetical protein